MVAGSSEATKVDPGYMQELVSKENVVFSDATEKLPCDQLYEMLLWAGKIY